MASLKLRGKTYWAQYYVNGKQKRVNLKTESLQIAKEELRKIESSLYRGEPLPLATKTSLSDILTKYLTYKRARSGEKNVQKELSYLRGIFGEACDALKVKNRTIAAKAAKRPSSGSGPRIDIKNLEDLTAQQVSEFLSDAVRQKGLAPRTVNHYRQILVTLCNWAMKEGGVRFPGDKNPVEPVSCFPVPKLSITFLRLDDIQEQLDSLADNVPLQTMVAVYIYAGLRREEVLWLAPEDIELDWGQHGAIWVRDKTVCTEVWMPKTKEGRIVPISRLLRGYLDKYLAVAGKLDSWLFTSPEGAKWDPDNFSGLLREVNSTNNLAWSCLDFRHTFGSQLAMKGESLFKISKLMGNSPEICQRHYAALMPESLMASVDFPEDQGVAARACATKQPAVVVDSRDTTLPVCERPKLRLIVNNR